KTLKHAVVNGKLTPSVKENGEWRDYHWKIEKVKGLPRYDDMPSKEELRTTALCSTFTSWAEVGTWKKKLRANCWDCTEKVRNVVKKVTEGLKTQEEKARALTYWVRRNVRYVASGEKHDYTPHLPQNVLGNRFGDCKDTS